MSPNKIRDNLNGVNGKKSASDDSDSGVNPNDSYERSITSQDDSQSYSGSSKSNNTFGPSQEEDDEESDGKERRIAEMLNDRDLNEEDENAD